jgi:hypothetical protein
VYSFGKAGSSLREVGHSNDDVALPKGRVEPSGRADWATAAHRRPAGRHARRKLIEGVYSRGLGSDRLAPATSAPGLGPPLPHLHRDWARPGHIYTGTRPAPATSALGLGLTPSTSASPGPGLGPPCHRDWARPGHIRTGTGLAARSSWTRTGFSCRCSSSRCSQVQPLLRCTCALPQRTKCEIHRKPATGASAPRAAPPPRGPSASDNFETASGVALRRHGAARAAGGSDLRPACDGGHGDERAFDDVGPVRELRQGGRLVSAAPFSADCLAAARAHPRNGRHAARRIVQRRLPSFVVHSVVCCLLLPVAVCCAD